MSRRTAIFSKPIYLKAAYAAASVIILAVLAGLFWALLQGFFGPSAIAATTYAVETVVLSHLEEQLAFLQDHDPQAHACVSQIYADEKEHLDISTKQLDENNKFTPILIRIVKFSTEMVIRFGMR